jgi:hypothetical protein
VRKKTIEARVVLNVGLFGLQEGQRLWKPQLLAGGKDARGKMAWEGKAKPGTSFNGET